MTAPSIEEQIARMRDLYPEMLVTGQCDWLASWRGPILPLQLTYTVEVLYARRYRIGGMLVRNGHSPWVRLIAPRLVERHPRTGELTPHVYWRLDEPEASPLCLYDPATSQWSADDFVADTAMPWVSDWLACYEGWLATGEWTGGGRHPSRPRQEATCRRPEAQSIDPNHDQLERSRRAAFHSLGQRIGTFASLPLMAAASAGSFRPLSWRDWNIDASTAHRSLGTSTSSPAPRLAA
jgi:hypothetical protein